MEIWTDTRSLSALANPERFLAARETLGWVF